MNASSTSSTSSSSPGYQVTTSTLQQAGTQAEQISQAIEQLSLQVSADTTIPDQPAGLGVGGAMHTMTPVWTEQLQLLSDQVAMVGQNLSATSGNYQTHENHVAGHLLAIGD
jgi:hypothetical protein